jgi:flagellar FliL protein
MAEASEAKDEGSKGGKGGFVVALLILAVIGAGAGAGFSLMVLNADKTAKAPAAGTQDPHKAADAGKPAAATGAAKGHDAQEAAQKEQVVGLEPILVTLAGPQKSWARLELSVVVGTGEKEEKGEKDDRATLLKVMSEDLMSFLRTVPLSHVESSVGLEYLREDLSEIARLRSKGRVRGVVLRSLVVE